MKITCLSVSITILIIFQFISLADGQCLSPLTAFGNSTIAPPVMDVSSTGFISNPLSTNANNSRSLAIRITWATVSNRVLTYAGIGDDSVSPGCQPYVLSVPPAFQAAGGWYIDSTSPDCFVELMANYSWPEALYSPSCSPLFTVDSSDPENDLISFDLIVKFNETYTITRAGTDYTQVKTVSSKLPISLVFPRTVTVDSSSVKVYSASSIEITAELISQDVTNSPPYLVRFITLNGRSFALNQPSTAYEGANTPTSNLVSFESDTILSTTRQATWEMSITPQPSACVLSGVYNVTYNLYWTGVDANGNPLPQNQNPLPNNSTVTISFTVASQDFCATVLTQSLVPSLKIFDTAPSPSTIYTGVSERLGFFTNQRIYFQAQVTSDNLPILSTTLSRFWITWGSTNQTDLVVNSSQSASNVDFQLSVPLASQPRDQALFNLLLAQNIFQVLQDRDTDYVFHALLLISYSTTGQKKRSLVKLSGRPVFNNNNGPQIMSLNFDSLLSKKQSLRALPLSGSASITAIKSVTLLSTATSPTPTDPIIHASSASGLMASLIPLVSLFAFFFL